MKNSTVEALFIYNSYADAVSNQSPLKSLSLATEAHKQTLPMIREIKQWD
jgi:hypothetical protein